MTTFEEMLTAMDQCEVLFSPIVDLSAVQIAGHECFISYPEHEQFHLLSSERLNKFSDDEVLEWELHRTKRVFEAIEKTHCQGLICFTITATSQREHHKKIIETILEFIQLSMVSPSLVVIKICNQQSGLVFEDMIATAHDYRQAGFLIAIVFSLADSIYLRLSSELKPAYLFIQRQVYQDVHLRIHEGRLLENMVMMSQQQNVVVVVENVQTEEELSYVTSIGVNFAQGSIIEVSKNRPTRSLAGNADWQKALKQHSEKKKNSALDLCIQAPFVEKDESLEQVVNRFLEDDDLHAIAVVSKEGSVVGVALRQKIMDVFASQFGRSLHAKKPVSNFVSDAIVVGHNMPINEVSHLITKKSQTELLQGLFVIVDEDKHYLGVGLFVDLLRAITDQSVNKEFERLLSVIQAQSEDKQKELEVLVESRTLELNNAMHNLQLAQEDLVQSEKMAALGQLVAGVAHEVNTPLGLAYTLITHLSERRDIIQDKLTRGALNKQDFQEFLDSAKETLAVSDSNLQKAAKLIQSFKQVAVDQSFDEKRVVSLVSMCEEILISTKHLFKKANHEVIINIESDIMMDTYPGALSQILSNLVMNANIHAFDDMLGGKIYIAAKKTNKDNVFLSVCDNGKGIPADIIKKIFDPFFTTKRGSGGSGLGLNIVYNLVHHKLNGKIECVSTVGQGTCFNITI